MRELSLFTGAGGGIWGSKLLGWKTVGYVERDPYCQKVIRQRMDEGHFDGAPIFGDIRLFTADGFAKAYSGMVDVITAGFPCQPFSSAGKRLGEDDPRNMWPETRECIATVRPRYAFLENVPALTSTPYFGRVIGDLTELGYDCQWTTISAAEVGAPHLRRRLWILATDSDRKGKHDGAVNAEMGEPSKSVSDSDSESIRQQSRWAESRRASPSFAPIDGETESLADSSSVGEREPANEAKTVAASRHTWKEPSGGSWWSSEPDVGRVANGVANRGHRLRALGNGQVPRVVVEAWERLTA